MLFTLHSNDIGDSKTLGGLTFKDGTCVKPVSRNSLTPLSYSRLDLDICSTMEWLTIFITTSFVSLAFSKVCLVVLSLTLLDGENIKNTNIAKVEFTRALHLYPPKENGWQPKVLTASSLKKTGIDVISKMIDKIPSEITWLDIEDKLKQINGEDVNLVDVNNYSRGQQAIDYVYRIKNYYELMAAHSCTNSKDQLTFF